MYVEISVGQQTFDYKYLCGFVTDYIRRCVCNIPFIECSKIIFLLVIKCDRRIFNLHSSAVHRSS